MLPYPRATNQCACRSAAVCAAAHLRIRNLLPLGHTSSYTGLACALLGFRGGDDGSTRPLPSENPVGVIFPGLGRLRVNSNTHVSIMVLSSCARQSTSRTMCRKWKPSKVSVEVDRATPCWDVFHLSRSKPQPQRFRCKFNQGQHLSACGGKILSESRTAHLLVGERNRRHKILEFNILDEFVMRIESARGA